MVVHVLRQPQPLRIVELIEAVDHQRMSNGKPFVFDAFGQQLVDRMERVQTA